MFRSVLSKPACWRRSGLPCRPLFYVHVPLFLGGRYWIQGPRQCSVLNSFRSLIIRCVHFEVQGQGSECRNFCQRNVPHTGCQSFHFFPVRNVGDTALHCKLNPILCFLSTRPAAKTFTYGILARKHYRAIFSIRVGWASFARALCSQVFISFMTTFLKCLMPVHHPGVPVSKPETVFDNFLFGGVRVFTVSS